MDHHEIFYTVTEITDRMHDTKKFASYISDRELISRYTKNSKN